MFERFTETARLAVFNAREEALNEGAAVIEPIHLLRSLERENSEGTIRFVAEHPKLERLREMEYDVGSAADPNNKKLSRKSKLVLFWAAEASNKERRKVIEPRHLPAGLLRLAEDLDGRPPARLSIRARLARICAAARGAS